MQNSPENTQFKPESQRDHTVKLVGVIFTILAALLVGVGSVSFIGASEVQENYSNHLSKTIYKLELVNKLHHNADVVTSLLTDLTNPATNDKAVLAVQLKEAHDSNTKIIKELDKVIVSDSNRQVLNQLVAYRNSSYHHIDSVTVLSLSGQPERAELYKEAYLVPVDKLHQKYLNQLSINFQKSADKRDSQASRLLAGFVKYQEILLILVLLATACAVFLMQYLFKKLKRENVVLSNEVKMREELQKELSKSQHIYKTLFNSNPIPMWIYDLKTLKILKVNNAAAEVYGYTQEEFLEKYIYDLKIPSDVDSYIKNIIPRTKPHEVFSNVKHRRKDGSDFWVEVHAHALPEVGNTIPRLVVAVNIDDQYKAIEKTELNEKLLREISSSIPGAVYQFRTDENANFSFPFISDGIRDIYGLSPEEVCQTPSKIFDQLHPEEKENVFKSIKEAIRTVKPWYVEARLWNSIEGRWKWVRGHSLPTRNMDGSVNFNGTLIDITLQKEAQEELARNEANLRALLDSSSKAIYMLDDELKILSFNKKADSTLNHKTFTNLVVGQNFCDFVEESLVEDLREDHALAMQGKTVSYETSYREGWYQVSFSPVVSHDNKILAVALNVLDISEQKRSIETIRHNKAQLSRAQQLAKLGNWELDLKTNVLQWSEEVFNIYGEQKHLFEPTLDAYKDKVHPADRQKVVDTYNKATETNVPLAVEHRIVLDDGTIRHIHEICEAEFNTAGKAVKLSGTVQDVTKYKEAERDIREAQHLLQSTLENIPEVIFSTDAEFNINYISPQCLEVTGFQEESFFEDRKLWARIIHPEVKEEVLPRIVSDTLAGRRSSNEVRILDSNGKPKWVMLRISPKLDENNRVVSIAGSAFDLTAFKDAEEKRTELTHQLMQQNKNLQQFAYIVSHNLRAPIANILGLTSIYDRRRPEAALNGRIIDNLATSAKLLDSTIRDLNDILTIRSKVDEAREKVDFKQTLDFILASIPESDIEDEIDLDYDFSEVPEIVALRSYVHSIMQNLITNALKYRSENRKLALRLKTFKVSEYICLEVEDNGQGIDLTKERDKIFGLYKRFHNNNKDGKGIGLHLVKTQAELLGGKVEVDSTVDLGSIFKIYLKHQE
ncbi:PAS domain S-box protein [uncultured Pontibacter sp.]|uniref:PAS domain S-box protein n=1 Tax=uncultured Pontibacter sp. TaxID=453356 RepID=UPI0026193644|nr:PAS domain S-box protein [uncultured Pontibacter sp.]